MAELAGKRALEVLDEQIAAVDRQLRELHRRRRQVARTWRDELVAAFDAGEEIGSLADRHGLTYRMAQAILYRAGRTVTGRETVQHQLDAHCRRSTIQEAATCP